MNKTRKRLVIFFLALLTIIFIILNVIWLDFSKNTKKLLLNTKYEMILDDDSSNIFNKYYRYYDSSNGLGYIICIPGYMNFSCKINIAGTLKKIENDDGTYSYSEDYHVSNILSIKPFKKYKYQYMIGKANDENGHGHGVILNNVYVNKNLELLDIHKTSITSQQEIEALFNNSYKKVESVHNEMLDFFGDTLNKLW